jgi:murein DD-endopeptidase MepM/ murein hydrolase activator NlpD
MIGPATGEESLSDLRARLDAIQAELDASTAKVEAAHAREEILETAIDDIDAEREVLAKEIEKLEAVAAKRARVLYTQGNTGMLEILFDDAADFADLATRADMLARVTQTGADDFIALARAQKRWDDIAREKEARTAELKEASEALKEEADKLQAQFESIADDYEKLQAKLGQSSTPVVQAAAPSSASSGSAPAKASGGMYCPVAGPVSFVDSYGAPRSGGRAHEGVDMMAGYGTPEVAIVSGTITYSGYSDLGGYVMYLSGDDGNLYVYVHSATQVSGGHFEAGEQIGTVGDTGNAAGNPHLHFEYHPGGGGSVNPTPLVASIC